MMRISPVLYAMKTAPLVSLVVLFFSQNVLAQNNKVPPPKTATSAIKKKPAAIVPATPTADVMRYHLSANHDRVIQEQKNIIEEQKRILNDYDACAVELLEARKAYDLWFTDHEATFKSAIPNTTILNDKLEHIQNLEVQVNAVENNTVEVVGVTFNKLAEFIKINNSRVEKCTNNTAKLTLLEKHMKDPILNALGISSEQISKSLTLFTPFLNQKQSETPLSYELKLVKTDCKMSIVIEVFQNKKTEKDKPIFRDTVIDEQGILNLCIDSESESAYRFYNESKFKVAEKPIDGFSRYFDFLKNLPAVCFPEGKELDQSIVELAASVNSTPYITYNEWLASYQKLKIKKGSQPFARSGQTATGPYGMQFVFIKAGKFTMGAGTPIGGESAATAETGNNDETPHTVMLTHNFIMQATTVNQKQWEASALVNPSYFKGPNLPVEQVSWLDATAFANLASDVEKLDKCYDRDGNHLVYVSGQGNVPGSVYECTGYRLPTEAEWEYAARANVTKTYSFGEDDRYDHLSDYSWYNANSDHKTHDVDSCPTTSKDCKNPWGLYHMYGNVMQWVQDAWASYSNTSVKDPLEIAGSYRVARGGSWSSGAEDSTSSERNGYAAPSNLIGFRLVRTIR